MATADGLDNPAVPRSSELENFVLWNAQQFAFPPSEWEAKTFAEVLLLPRVEVTRPPKHDLLAVGMVPHDCHANCAAQEANDPDGESRHVWGWLINGSDLILHSVVEIRGQWLCMTPQHREGPARFNFIPDAAIEWRNADNGKEPFRGGVQVPQGLRSNPEQHVRMWERFRDLVSLGMPVAEARQLVDDTLGAELRQMAQLIPVSEHCSIR
ncbi:hypothetical protein [Rhizobium leguminosarum]|uniref:hypothetical protein n=1 Tax=Rhizobium leguminosarum TaxID=384 RepID=UPI001FE15791|nr:hypothetical protein [Rhizobium leguminosarum]